MSRRKEPLRPYLPLLCLLPLAWVLLGGCERGDPGTPPSLFGADSTSFRAEIDSARMLLSRGDIAGAEPIVRTILAGATGPAMVKQRAMATGYLGNIMQQRNDLDSAIACHRMAIAMAMQHGRPEFAATARINLGVALELKGDHAGALEQQLEAFRQKEQMGDSAGMARGLNNIGMLHFSTNDTLKSAAAFRRALAINERTGDSASWHRSLLNLAVVDLDLGHFDTALVRLRRSLEVRPARLFGRSESAIFTNMALAYEGSGRTDSALVLYEKALNMAREQDDLRALGEGRHYLADLLVRQRRIAPALAHLDTALQIAREVGDRDTEKQILLSLANAHAAAGDHQQAFRTHKAHTALADSLMNAGKDAVMRELHVKYEVEHTGRENERLRAAGELAEAKAQGFRWLLLAALLLAVAIGVVAWLLAQRARERAHRREADLEQQALRAQMDPHFLFNALNTIPGLYASTDARTASAYVGHLSNLLRLILESSRKVQAPLRQEIELIQHYLHVSASRHPGLFAYTIHVDPAIDTDTVTIPPMLLQPLVENAILHGLVPRRNGGELHVEITRSGNTLVCRIRDNGIGRKASAAASTPQLSPSRGLEITAERMRQFNRGSTAADGLRILDLYDDDGHATGTEVIVRTIIHQPWS